jgi:hypothetical protein
LVLQERRGYSEQVTNELIQSGVVAIAQQSEQDKFDELDHSSQAAAQKQRRRDQSGD